MILNIWTQSPLGMVGMNVDSGDHLFSYYGRKAGLVLGISLVVLGDQDYDLRSSSEETVLHGSVMNEPSPQVLDLTFIGARSRSSQLLIRDRDVAT